MKIERFEDIDAWKKGRELTRCVYALTRKLEFSKDYGLKDQITRASVSIMNNVAEGFDGVVMPSLCGFWCIRKDRQLK